jgi:hypothetical protein
MTANSTHMTILPDIAEFVAKVELFSKRKLNYPSEVSELLQIAVQTGLIKEFGELTFQAKFLTRTQEVIRQVGNKTEGIKKLSTEYETVLKKSMGVLNQLVERTSPEIGQNYLNLFFSMEPDSLLRLMNLYSDLSWIKNWQIDGKPLPYEAQSSKKVPAQDPSNPMKEENQQEKVKKSLFHIQRIALLAAILLVLFLLIDPPVTILGWILSLGITTLLAYIVIQTVFLIRNPYSQ